MKYKVNPSSALFEQIQSLRVRSDKADAAARAWLEKHFGKPKNYCVPRACFAGGIECVQLDEKPPGWKQMQGGYHNLYAPKAIKANQPVFDEWAELPVVLWSELKDLIGYKTYQGFINGRFVYNTTPGVFLSETVVLLSTHQAATNYVPVEGMEEILESEYLRLKGL